MLASLPLVALAVMLAAPVTAAPGDPDTMFHGDSKRLVDIGTNDIGNDVAIQPDGRVVTVGGHGSGTGFSVARMLPNGALDTSFSGDGMRTFEDIGDPGFPVARAVHTLSNNRMLVAGQAYTSGFFAFGLIRVLPGGQQDMTFGTGGEALAALGADGAWDVLVAPSGKIIVVGSGLGVGGDNDFALARFSANGILDQTFGPEDNPGYAFADFGNQESGRAGAIAPDGSIVVAGLASGSGGGNFGVARFTPGGEPDANFGTGGITTIDAPGDGTYDEATGVTVMPDGDIVVVGNTLTGAAAVVRLEPDGDPDPTFDDDGIVTFDPSSTATAMDVVRHHFGTILVAGELNEPGPQRSGLVFRLEPDGDLDPTFGGGDGWTSMGYATRDDSLSSVAVDARSIMVAGTSAGEGDNDVFVARLRDRDRSTISVAFARTPAKVRFTGRVTPNHSGQKVMVRFFRKQGGSFRLVGRKTPTLNASSSYSTSFARPTVATCRVMVTYGGDLHHLPSNQTRTFGC